VLDANAIQDVVHTGLVRLQQVEPLLLRCHPAATGLAWSAPRHDVRHVAEQPKDVGKKEVELVGVSSESRSVAGVLDFMKSGGGPRRRADGGDVSGSVLLAR
jgi:hypothetical protein